MLVVLLGLITASLNSAQMVPKLKITTYYDTGNEKNLFTLGTRVLLTCDVSELTEGNEAVSYRWYHNCTEVLNRRCEIRDREPYYRVVNDTLLVDVTSWDQGGRYSCFVTFSITPGSTSHSSITVAGNTVPFLYTPTSLLPEDSVLTDVQQATGRNGQQWITCRSGGQGTRPQIWMGSKLVANSSTANSVKIGLATQHPNGLYHCISARLERKYFSLFLRNLVTLPTPNLISSLDNITWTLTLSDGSQVGRYIVVFECRVRNITFVEKYVSVSASGGTGQVATSVSCFGSPGHLYRMKVWAVSGPNISPALVCTTDGQCTEEGGDEPSTIETFTSESSTIGTIIGEMSTIGTFIGVGVGSSMFLLLALSILVVIILVVVAATVKRKPTCKQTRQMAVEGPYYSTVGENPVTEMTQQGSHVHYENADSSENVHKDKIKDDGAFTDDIHMYEVVDRAVHRMTRSAPKESSSPASANNVPAVYAAVDKSKKKRAMMTGIGDNIKNSET